MDAPAALPDLGQFLGRYSDIMQAAAKLRENTRDQFAVGLLIRFEELDKTSDGDVYDSKKRVIRDSLRRVVAELLKHHAGAPVDALLVELDMLETLTSPSSKFSVPRHRTGRKVVALLTTACLSAGASAAIFLPQTSAARTKTTKAEQEIAKLKVRLAEVANEKAQAQDAKEYANVAAQELAEVAVIAAEITTDLELCIDYGNEAVDIVLKIADGYTYSDRSLEKFGDDWTAACNDALGNAADLREYLTQAQVP